MATSAVCPSCKTSFRIPATFPGGFLQCPNPQCGQMVDVMPPSIRSRPGPPPAEPTEVRPKWAKPELLDRLPGTPFTSPAVHVGAGALVLVYGVVLSIAVTIHEKNRPQDPPPLVNTPRPQNPAPIPPPSPPPPPPPMVTQVAPKPEVKKTDGLPKPPGDTPKDSTPQARAETTMAIAKVDIKPVVPAPPPPPVKDRLTQENLGPMIDPDNANDVTMRKDVGVITFFLPGGRLHLLSPTPEIPLKNAPRSLIEVEGDFDAQVRLTAKMRPGAKLVPPFPFTFQGAGLLLWENENSYLRLERTGIQNGTRPVDHQISLEALKNGKPTAEVPAKDIADVPASVRMVRKGGDIDCMFSLDGVTWVSIQKVSGLYSGKVGIGISATNISAKPFPARFENFALIKDAARPKS